MREQINTDSKFKIPSWMLEKNEYDEVKPQPAKNHFLQKTLRHVSEVFENEFFCERYANKPMLLQSIDARVKLLIFLCLIVFSGFSSNIVILLALGVIALLYTKTSGLNMKDYVRRVWRYIPVIAFAFAIPGASSLFVQGSPLFYVIKPGVFGLQSGLYFSGNGLAMAIRLALRPGISLSFGFLLLLTTRWTKITSALASMRVPLIFISILNMAYRYIFVMSTMASDMMEARTLRTVGKLETAENRRFMSRSFGHLFLKSHYLSEEIYDAMVCRCFTGKPVSIEKSKIKSTDILFMINNAIILLLLIEGEHLF